MLHIFSTVMQCWYTVVYSSGNVLLFDLQEEQFRTDRAI